jgi:hypothetical protein
MYVYEFIGVDIVPDIEEFFSILVVKDGRIGASSEYSTRYRRFFFDFEVMISI